MDRSILFPEYVAPTVSRQRQRNWNGAVGAMEFAIVASNVKESIGLNTNATACPLLLNAAYYIIKREFLSLHCLIIIFLDYDTRHVPEF